MDDDTRDHYEVDEPAACWHCDQPTTWFERSLEIPLHPGECTRTAWQEFNEADHDAEQEPAQHRADEAPPAGTRRTDPLTGQTSQWTGSLWRHVPRSELEREEWRRSR